MHSILLFWALVAVAALGWTLSLVCLISLLWRQFVPPEASIPLSPKMDLQSLTPGTKDLYLCRIPIQRFFLSLGQRRPSCSGPIGLFARDAEGTALPIQRSIWSVPYNAGIYEYKFYGRTLVDVGGKLSLLGTDPEQCNKERQWGTQLHIFPTRRIRAWALVGLLVLGVAVAFPATLIAETAF